MTHKKYKHILPSHEFVLRYRAGETSLDNARDTLETHYLIVNKLTKGDVFNIHDCTHDVYYISEQKVSRRNQQINAPFFEAKCRARFRSSEVMCLLRYEALFLGPKGGRSNIHTEAICISSGFLFFLEEKLAPWLTDPCTQEHLSTLVNPGLAKWS